jgi:hypothetical protein
MEEDALRFEKYRPKITLAMVSKAAADYGEGNEIVSLEGQRTAIDAFILLLATDSETIGPYLFSHHVARQLCAVLIDADFGPLPK